MARHPRPARHTHARRLVALLIPVLAACSGHVAQRPAHWPEVRSPAGMQCPDLNGHYHSKGDEAETNLHRYAAPVHLGQLLFPGLLATGNVDPKWASHVDIRQDGDASILVTLIEKGKAFHVQRLRLGADYHCDGTRLTLHQSFGATYEYGPGKGILSHAFGRAADGSIIVEADASAVRMAFLVLPDPSRNVHWYRFFPATPAP